MSLRLRRNKKIKTIALPQGMVLKLRLIPWMRTQNNCVWLASLAVGKSKKQINDWLQQRKKRSVNRLSSKLTGKLGPKAQALAIRQVRQWIGELPPGDSLCLRCESALPEKQFQVWKKWFTKHEEKDWVINDEFKYFLYSN
jgi:hypothetical protein